MGARYVIPFDALEGLETAEMFRTLIQVELEQEGAFRLRAFCAFARFADVVERRVTVWLARGYGGTAREEMAAVQIPRPDPAAGDPVFRMRRYFLVEPHSEVRDLIVPYSLPSAQRMQWYYGDRGPRIEAGGGLRVMVGCKQAARAVYSGTLEVESV